LFFDVITTAGIYSLLGFEVSPATVIGLLTILGFSLYDTVIVFDKVEENTRGAKHSSSSTYAEEANLAVNQTLMRSIHTTIIGILPLLALLVVAVWILGVGTLLDLAIVQVVGIITGTFSSIFLATPLLVLLKEHDPDTKRQTAKVLARREKVGATA
ncbi:MAG: protein translocase subunit SecF, partial [Dietzia sp.]|nr:protein translocase subunit SecF [Dietzia sp.]